MRRYLAIPAAVVAVAATGLLGAPVATAGGGGACRAAVNFESGVTEVGTDHVCWSPVVAQVAVGSTLTFVNDSGLMHNLSGPGPIGEHEFGYGARVRVAFPQAGIFPYSCSLHPAMAGAVVVGNPLGASAPAPAAVAPAPSAPAVSLSSADDGGGGLLGSTTRVAGAGAAAAGGLAAAGVVAVRRRRNALPAG
ncbi:MAG TPA: hypothetical protein VNA12_10805 [Mycobacteriales bacterium]|nr:hypothetical protein [Mycobacteriales bacterium]